MHSYPRFYFLKLIFCKSFLNFKFTLFFKNNCHLLDLKITYYIFISVFFIIKQHFTRSRSGWFIVMIVMVARGGMVVTSVWPAGSRSVSKALKQYIFARIVKFLYVSVHLRDNPISKLHIGFQTS